MIKIKVNGKEWQVAPGSTAIDMLSKLKLSSKVCVVEKNGEILPKDQLTKISLKEGDSIEIIRMMGGG